MSSQDDLKQSMTAEEEPRIRTLLQSVSGQYSVSHHRRQVWQPPTDVFETSDTVEVRIEVPGVEERDFKVTFTQQHLRVRGIRRDDAHKCAVHQMEISYGEFMTDIVLTTAVVKDRIEARYSDGFLRITLPKA